MAGPVWGKPSWCRRLRGRIGAELFDLRLTTIEPQDLRGLPYFDHEAAKTIWYRPEDLPDTDAPAILFLDELTAAAPCLATDCLRAAAGTPGGPASLPDSVMIVAAGNRIEDGAIAYDMGTALSDRLIHMIVQANPEDWLKNYAVERGHPSRPSRPSSAPGPTCWRRRRRALRRGQMIACTPRSWTSR
jgi:MoxR-like ATPase